MRVGVLCALCAACHGGAFTLSGAGAQVRVATDPFSLSLRDAAGREVLATFPGSDGAYGAPAATADAWRWEDQILEGWDGLHSHESGWVHGTAASLRSRGTDAASLRAGDLDVDLSVSGSRVRIALHALSSGSNKLGISFRLGAREHFFGLGERFASVDHRGLSLYSWAEEGGLGQGEATPRGPQNPYPNGPSMTYYPVPFVLSSAGYGLQIEGSARSEFHLGSERADAWRIAVFDGSVVIDIDIHGSPLDSIADFTADARPPIPAPWVFGPRREVGLYDSVDGVPEWQALRQRGVPTTALDDNTHFLPARSELGREDALRAWTATAHAEGFKVLGYATPYISMTLPNAAADLQAGLAQDLFVKDAAGKTLQVFFSSGEPQTLATIDLTNPKAVTFFQSLLQRALDLGYDGWMHDFGEYLTPSARLFDGRDGLHAHDDFPLLSARAAHDLLEQQRPGDYFIFVRSGWAGTSGLVPGVWSGDPEATFDETQGLPAQLRAGLNLSISGAPYWGSDIGGYKCLTDAANDKEMYLRWAALGAVSPLMMNDTACATVLGPAKAKWGLWSDDETTTAYAALARLHTRLAPYFQTLAVQAHQSGRPLMIHPWLLYPQREEAAAVDDAFFLGPSLLAAPVVRRGATSKRVWLPPGAYVDLRNQQVFAGDAVAELPAPLGELPLLLVAGQILPLLDPAVETLAPASDPSVISSDKRDDRLDVQVALSVGQTAQLTLADGTELSAERTATDSGNPAGLSAATDLSECALCFAETRLRLRANGDLAARSDLTLREVRLHSNAPVAKRIRWDVIRIP
jgi:alpha-glucosidase